jgi:ribose transport system ATP-binding protein
MTTAPAAPVFEVRDVEKAFPGVLALKGVNMSLLPGSIHALLGENGAGKSTLIKVITGVHQPTAGSIHLDGVQTVFASPRDAIARGVGVVHQERNLFPRFSVAENIFLEQLSASYLKPVDYARLNREARPWLEALELDIDPATPVSDLSAARMQLVEIAKALSLRSRVLLLDEPTSSLTSSEADLLFTILRRLRDDGTSLVFVSHKLEEVQEICDRVTVLRDGANACDSLPMEGVDRNRLVQMMIGRAEGIASWRRRETRSHPEALGLSDVSTPFGHVQVSLSVRKGEIVGLYGLVGAGRTELAKAIMGKFPVTGGEIRVDGTPVRIGSVAEAVHRHRIGYISEDRKNEGLILLHSVLANSGVPIWRNLSRLFGTLTDGRVRDEVIPYLRKLEVKTPSLAQSTVNLSGGNQQKISVAKWLAAGVPCLIVDEPSVGIDIKTKAYLHELLRELAGKGTAILLISSDMPEMIALADRIVVMDDYRITGEVENTGVYADMSHRIMDLIHGSHAASGDAPSDAAVRHAAGPSR